MSGNTHIDDFLRKKLKDYSKEPPVDVWFAVSSGLKKKERIHLISLTWRIAAGFALLLMVGLGWHFLSGPKQLIIPTTADNAFIENIPDSQTSEENIISGRNEFEKESSNQILEKEDLAGTILPWEPAQSELSGNKKVLQTDNIPSSGNNNEVVEGEDNTILTGRSDSPERSYSLLIKQAPPAGVLGDIIKLPDNQQNIDRIIEFNKELTALETSDQKNRNTWYISGMAAPEYSYRTVNNGEMANSTYFNNAENALFTWSGGLQVGYQAAKRLHVQSGMIFSRYGLQIENMRTFGSVDPSKIFTENTGFYGATVIDVGNSIGSIGTGNSNVTYMSYNSGGNEEYRADITTSITSPLDQANSMADIDAALMQYIDFIEVPLNLRYRLNNGKIKFNLLGGFSSNILVGNKVFYISGDEKKETGKTENIRTISYSGNLGLSVDYEISDHFMLLVEPRYKYYLHSINEDELINARPYLLGIFTGIRYKF